MPIDLAEIAADLDKQDLAIVDRIAADDPKLTKSQVATAMRGLGDRFQPALDLAHKRISLKELLASLPPLQAEAQEKIDASRRAIEALNATKQRYAAELAVVEAEQRGAYHTCCAVSTTIVMSACGYFALSARTTSVAGSAWSCTPKTICTAPG